MTRNRHLLASTALVSVFALTPALAETNWTGASSNIFNVTGNWDGDFNGGDLVIDGDGVIVVTTSNNAIGADAASSAGPRSLVISGGARLTGNGVDPSLAIGWSSGVTSYVTVTGVGATSGDASQLITNAATLIGYQSGTTGVLTVDEGAVYYANGIVGLGNSAGSTGYLTVDNGSSFYAYNNLYVGFGEESTGYLTIDNGSSFNAIYNVAIGYADGSVGTLTIDHGSTFTLDDTGQLQVGSASSGSTTGLHDRFERLYGYGE